MRNLPSTYHHQMSAAGAATMPEQPDLLRGTGSAPRAPLRRPLVPMPDAVRRLFALFPLHEWPAASSVDAAADAVEKPTPVSYTHLTLPTKA